MPYDLTMCPGKNCPIKHSCFRFTSKICGRQDFFVHTPYNFVSNSCKDFISNRPDVEKIRLQAYKIWQQQGCPDGQSLENWLQAEKDLSQHHQ
ncbi:hypothetical protein B6N60_01182 [Richelia sinica FACHB-800]|uniref:DUF2934 domain-containing protein n=1 Tax=Richelia sinica FACHB-800 TaxID=1357546 RepID=A0A975Y3U6_9NOST|nr:DUF2934 domain-containing protein [Richelia sinica]QXE22499.1 hypothetical protein B6N60_01182 [Richelia sinica FACHB-800]